MIAVLGDGHAFGEMSLLSTATIRAAEDTELLEIGKDDFERLVATDRQLADAVKRISHRRRSAISAPEVRTQRYGQKSPAKASIISTGARPARCSRRPLTARALRLFSETSSTRYRAAW
jgi:CRP-like cAMP-binding protein